MCTISGNSEFVDWLINSHTNADFPEKASQLVNAIDNDGKSPLHLAAASGYEAVVKTLLAKNANINVQDKSQNTPLSLAILNGVYTLIFSQSSFQKRIKILIFFKVIETLPKFFLDNLTIQILNMVITGI